MVDHGQLHVAAADVEAHRALVAAEKGNHAAVETGELERRRGLPRRCGV
jgi:hypothetical protein